MATEKHKVYTCGDPVCDTEANSMKNIRIHQTKSGHGGEPRISTRKTPARVTRSQAAIARKASKATTATPTKKNAPAKKSTPKKGPARKATKRPTKKVAAKRAPARKSRSKK